MAASAAAAIEAHLAGCPGCRDLLSQAASAAGATGDAALADTDEGRTPAVAAAPPGELDEYRLIRPLGQGAMGQVFLGHDTLLDRQVAIKFVNADASDPAVRARLLTEARAIARLHHPNVVAIYRVAALAGRPYLVSEFVQGTSLDRVSKPLPWREVLHLGLGLSRGLAAAHRRGVLHRDIKPANAMRTDGGEPKLLDFGLAKLLGAADGEAPAPAPGTPASGAPAPGTPAPGTPASGAPAPGTPAPGAPAPGAPSQDGAAGLTQDGAIVGSPLYMAPEIWRGELATPRSDVYSLGVLLYELCTGQPPHRGRTLLHLSLAVQGDRAPALGAVVPGIDAGFAAVVDRCLDPDAAARYDSGEALSLALDEIVPFAPGLLPAGNPYRGLRPFGAEHRAVFFGRETETQAVLALLREEPLVLVTGDSGVGKSSLCKAGVVPRVLDGALGEPRAWVLASLVPGREPLSALVLAVAPVLGERDDALLAELADDTEALGRRLRRRGADAPGLLLFIDQMEELLTQAGPERDRLCEVLAHLSLRAPSVRLLMTVRGDFLIRLAALSAAGRALCRVLYLLGPLGRDALREAIAQPARARGFAFESEAMVAELLGATEQAEGGLPLLQFALAELWEARDAERRLIPASALVAIGGVSGALARHADGVIERLLPEERAAARRLLIALMTGEGTRARRREAEVIRDAADRAALDALVKGRLLVAHRPEEEDPNGGGAEYEVAHEALVRGWGRLRGWLDESTELRALRQRLRGAAAEWRRLGHAEDALWGPRHLGEAADLRLAAAGLSEPEAAFLRASTRRARRRAWGRLGAALAVPATLALLYGGLTLQRRYTLERQIAADLREAREALAEGRRRHGEVAALRDRAFADFDAGRIPAGEAAWARALEGAAEGAGAYEGAGRALERALLRDSHHKEVLRLFSEVLYEQVLAAERDSRPGRRRDLLLRLANYDQDGAARGRLQAPALLHLHTDPPGAAVAIERYEDRAGRRIAVPVPDERHGDRAGRVAVPVPDGATPRSLAPGSYRLTLRAPGRATVRYPLLLGRAEVARVHVALPAAAAVPPGFVYVPPGSFLYGSADDEGLRRDLLAQPLHTVRTPAYLIGRTEVSFAAWLDYLRALPRDERARRRPMVDNLRGALRLEETAGGYALAIKPTDREYRAAAGEPLRYPDRDRRAAQDWRRFPVSAVSWEDALAYVSWLRSSGQVRGARVCTEHEWERAARGADDRLYPGGDQPAPDDANFDATYGRRKLGFGPDEVGSHPASDSPFGVADMMGNVWEWARSAAPPEESVYRGGAWYFSARTGRSANRQPGEPALRDIMIGLRVCADPPAGSGSDSGSGPAEGDP